MIVVLGSPVLARGAIAGRSAAAGLAAETAMAAAAAGSAVQVVGKVGDDAGGDEVLLALTRAGVGHAAVLRDAAHPTPTVPAAESEADTGRETDDPAPDDPAVDAPEPSAVGGLGLEAADVELALRYLTDFAVLVLADRLDVATRATALDAAAFAGAHVIDLHGSRAGTDQPAAERYLEITAFEAPTSEPEAFGQVVGRYAAGLDAGRQAADAFRDATRAGHWEPASG